MRHDVNLVWKLKLLELNIVKESITIYENEKIVAAKINTCFFFLRRGNTRKGHIFHQWPPRYRILYSEIRPPWKLRILTLRTKFKIKITALEF